VSVIIPIFNGEAFLEECLKSIDSQRIPEEYHLGLDGDSISIHIQVSIYDDASTDSTPQIIQKWKENFNQSAAGDTARNGSSLTFSLIHERNNTGEPGGGKVKG